MIRITIILLGQILFCCCTQTKIDNSFEIPFESTNLVIEEYEKVIEEYENFELYYSFAGLGSGMGTMQPTFKMKGKNFVYTSEQNSYVGKPYKNPVNICQGTIRNSSIDSILNIVKDIKDTLIYKTNIGITSGGIHNISIKHDTISITFRLHNASDATAQKIIEILNSNIPTDIEKLWLYDFPDEK